MQYMTLYERYVIGIYLLTRIDYKVVSDHLRNVYGLRYSLSESYLRREFNVSVNGFNSLNVRFMLLRVIGE